MMILAARLFALWRGLPLFIHLLAAALLVQTVVLSIVYVGQVRLINTSVEQLARLNSAQTVPLLSGALSNALAQGDFAGLQGILDDSVSSNGIAAITVFDTQGKVILSRSHASTAVHGRHDAHLPDVAVPLQLSGQAFGRAQISFANHAIDALYDELFWRRVVMVSLSLLVAVLGFGLTAYFLTLPLKRLTEASRNLSSGASMPAKTITFGAELNTLQHSFADMSQAIQGKVAALEEAREAAERANRAKTEFLSKVSHEIRTPMNGVMGMLELLRETDLSASQLDLTETAHNSGEALMTIINDILDISKIEAGKLLLETRPIALRNTCEAVISLFSASASRRGIALSLQMAPDLPLHIQGDPVRLRQILANLIGNALKFTAHGSVSLQVSMSSGGKNFALQVSDTGLGIEPSALAGIFEPFVQADNTHTRRFGGTGLGLSIVKNLCEAMGGDIAVASVVGQGATFTATLPLVVAHTAPAATQAVAAAPVRAPLAMHVLLVEDNVVNRKLAELYLARLGCTFDSAEDGEQALARLSHRTYSAVLMDCQMPVMDGFEATLAIRKREAASVGKIPRACIIAMTANAGQSDRERCLEVGMDDYLAKPYKLDAFHQMLRKYA